MPNPFTAPVIRCAFPNCEHIRKEANHWFVVTTTDFGPPKEAFVCFSYMAEIELDDDEFPVCGQQCAQKMFERYLQIGRLGA
jgi:hypothetical protein